MSSKKTKTPTPRQIAAKVALTQIQKSLNFGPEDMMALFPKSRITPEKAGKVFSQLEKLSNKFVARLQKIIDQFEKTN